MNRILSALGLGKPAIPRGRSRQRARQNPQSKAAMSSRYDLAVIGAGSAGFWVAIAAVELGARVALIGHRTIGGTCVNIGCMPSKNLDPRHRDALPRQQRRTL